MTAGIRERVPVRVIRQGGSYQDSVTLTGRRFMGVMLHPVPRSEMARQHGTDCRGCRVVADWPDTHEDHPIRKGDTLEVRGRPYEVLDVREYPGMWVEVFIREPDAP